MSQLWIYQDGAAETPLETTAEGAVIAARLGEVGVRFERWKAGQELPAGAGQPEILAAYQTELDRLRRESGYGTADVVRLARGTPNAAALREKFLSEHRHTEDEVRFFVEGSGTFYLRIAERVFAVRCERDDLIGVPANTRHWFDMGGDPHFCAIRLFTDPAGWVGHFTGDEIATRYPTHDRLPG